MLKEIALKTFLRGCERISPNILREIVHVSESALVIKEGGRSHTFPLSFQSKVYIVAIGKAAIGMAKAAEDSLGNLLTAGIVIAPETMSIVPLRSRIYLAGKNNLPDEQSVVATKKVLEFLKQYDEHNALVLFLISGGGSALFCCPLNVTLSEKLSLIRLMVKHGASIQELNTIRQYLSEVKGGKTLTHVSKSKIISLILSDIVGDPIDLIASGPTVVPSGDRKDPFELLDSLLIPSSDLTAAVKKQLADNQKNIFPLTLNASNFVVINNELILKGIRTDLEELGFNSYIVTKELCGDATTRGEEFSKLIGATYENFSKTLQELHNYKINEKFEKLALVYGGETTVKLKGSGCGGRNQEMVLSCLKHLKLNSPTLCFSFAFMSVGTDGQDGPNDAAGAIITEFDVQNADLDQCIKYLNNSDSYNFWKTFNKGQSHIVIGPTGTNVMDIQLLLLSVKNS